MQASYTVDSLLILDFNRKCSDHIEIPTSLFLGVSDKLDFGSAGFWKKRTSSCNYDFQTLPLGCTFQVVILNEILFRRVVLLE